MASSNNDSSGETPSGNPQPSKLPSGKPDNSQVSPFRQRLHEIIFEADDFAGALFDVLLLLAIVASIVVVCLDTVPDIGRVTDEKGNYAPGPYHGLLSILSWGFTIFFTIEYLLRMYCVRRPLKYAVSFWGIIDLMSFLPDYLVLGFSGRFTRGSFTVIRSLRLLRVFRIFKLGWFQHEAEELGDAVWRSRAKITVFITVVLILVTVSGTLMYEIENWQPSKSGVSQPVSTSQFQSIPDGIYWAIVTMTTVGYGDIVPTSVPGKVLSAVLILIGYSLIIVPTGFVSAEIIGHKKTNKTSTRSCPSCITEGHDADAVYCKHCGELME